MESGSSELPFPKKRLFLCDSRQSAISVSQLFTFGCDLVVPTTAVAAFELTRLGVDFQEVDTAVLPRNSCGINEFMQTIYHEIRVNLKDVLAAGQKEQSAAQVYIDTFTYHLKLTLDYPIFVLKLLEVSLDSSVNEVWVPTPTEIYVDAIGLIDSNCSEIALVVADFVTNRGLNLNTYDSTFVKESISGLSKRRRRASHRSLESEKFIRRMGVSLRSSTHQLFRRLEGLRIRRRSRVPLVLGWNCREVRSLQRRGKPTSIIVRQISSGVRPKRDEKFGRKIAEEFKQLFQSKTFAFVSGETLWPILEPVVIFIASQYRSQLRNSDLIATMLRKRVPSIVIVNTTTSLEPEIPALRMALKKLAIPLGCWMHGGYGAYTDSGGYDISDLRLSDLLIAYGNVSENAFRNPSLESQSSGAQLSPKVVSLGSAWLEEQSRKTLSVESLALKPKLVFCLGPRYVSNRFYFGYNRNSVDLGLCRQSIQIASALVDFSSEFEIVIKDYPGSELGFFWDDFCKSSGLKYVTDEETFVSLLRTASCVIFTWVSTTVFETLMAGVPFLLWDDSNLRPEVKSLMNHYGGNSEKLEEIGYFFNYWLRDQRYLDLDHEKLKSEFLRDLEIEHVGRELLNASQGLSALSKSLNPI